MICPVCKTSIVNSKHIWKYEFSEIIQCNFCGVVHHVRNSTLYKEQVFATYSKNSWGNFNKEDYDSNLASVQIAQHADRMKFNLQFFQEFISFDNKKSILDIGAGIGLLEFIVEQTNEKLADMNFVLLEPIAENYQILRERYSNYVVLNGHLEEYENIESVYDVIFCQGVDYLFNDIDKSFSLLHRLLKDDGLLFISRNVFIDMPCYFGGEKIDTLQKLFSPNPLINIFFLETHYREFLEKNFEILSSKEYLEKYGKGLAVGKSYNYVLKKKSLIYDQSAIMNQDFKEVYDIAIQKLSVNKK
ncbi:class I SAM-dependent methyltransferase [Sulfurospirillum barnesii]|uniref:Putative S-adenosylmethionine-dependent methyltransferase involved in bacterial cell division n=1 Tax=Sulfurospirillum barnesii (strain ATCC 700032 / DSM 10660 / SES-3) TaxID=760154 RepID=I3Y0K0_SULBS|nr:class I SAM-dependent methyltransferase [Sulfurospirillum barnesii]AFL69724.1 putative S-adenosylmethionine-dependent methyltransferase involved in bacterial cell division [Sulfurospirillum barnesii SES-3]